MRLEVVLLTLFFIALPFPSASPPRRNDANCLLRSLVTVFNIVGYQQQQHAIHRSNRLPSAFSAFNPVLFHERVGIFEDLPCDLEADPMLSPVGSRLGVVPFEP